MLDITYKKAQVGEKSYAVMVSSVDIGEESESLISVSKDETGKCFLSIDDGKPDVSNEDYFGALEAAQNRLGESEKILRCCGNCQNFQMTGKSRQMSDGLMGYCLLDLRRNGNYTRDDIVSIFDRCDAFAYGPQEFIRNLDNIEAYKSRLEQEKLRAAGEKDIET